MPSRGLGPAKCKIVTMNPAAPMAQFLAARGDRIVALGGTADVQKWIGPNTKVID